MACRPGSGLSQLQSHPAAPQLSPRTEDLGHPLPVQGHVGASVDTAAPVPQAPMWSMPSLAAGGLVLEALCTWEGGRAPWAPLRSCSWVYWLSRACHFF